ncbi:hypothetical protein AX774_g251 [Zancudomyces culisetae]|uniref:Glucose-induced degradation protein 4-like protein n=1 Tax=Zancudomyces culisetae TaxID=1213189 RepID=A0A1R1PZ14_ZANCU|nr:hypothetical protein AX774_g251 [Zancudomyces culisetae]|eukprot:OMH86179.1 hypothetical protein AX774_g251 [Zancudomyces culisetae]
MSIFNNTESRIPEEEPLDQQSALEDRLDLRRRLLYSSEFSTENEGVGLMEIETDIFGGQNIIYNRNWRFEINDGVQAIEVRGGYDNRLTDTNQSFSPEEFSNERDSDTDIVENSSRALDTHTNIALSEDRTSSRQEFALQDLLSELKFDYTRSVTPPDEFIIVTEITELNENSLGNIPRGLSPLRRLNSSFLRPGIRFKGVQRLINADTEILNDSRLMNVPDISYSTMVDGRRNAKWSVIIELEEVDIENGVLCGSLRMFNIPWYAREVITKFSGEIVDFRNFDQWTRRWGASTNTDLAYWSLLNPHNFETPRSGNAGRDDSFWFTSTTPFDPEWRGRYMPSELDNYLFIRIKETGYIKGSSVESQMFIDGFYYLILNRKSGRMDGIFYDNKPYLFYNQKICYPIQKLELRPTNLSFLTPSAPNDPCPKDIGVSHSKPSGYSFNFFEFS